MELQPVDILVSFAVYGGRTTQAWRSAMLRASSSARGSTPLTKPSAIPGPLVPGKEGGSGGGGSMTHTYSLSSLSVDWNAVASPVSHDLCEQLVVMVITLSYRIAVKFSFVQIFVIIFVVWLLATKIKTNENKNTRIS